MAFLSLLSFYGTLPWEMISLGPELKALAFQEVIKMGTNSSRKFMGAAVKNSMFQSQVLNSLIQWLLTDPGVYCQLDKPFLF